MKEKDIGLATEQEFADAANSIADYLNAISGMAFAEWTGGEELEAELAAEIGRATADPEESIKQRLEILLLTVSMRGGESVLRHVSPAPDAIAQSILRNRVTEWVKLAIEKFMEDMRKRTVKGIAGIIRRHFEDGTDFANWQSELKRFLQREGELFQELFEEMQEVLHEGFVTGGRIAATTADLQHKSWGIVVDGSACGTCVANSEEGSLPIAKAFQSGDWGPPAHWGCRCIVVYS